MIDPQIALGVTTPKFDNPLDQYGKAASVRNAMQQGQIGQQQIQEGALGLQQKQIEMDQAAKLRDALQNSPDIDTALPAVMKINPTVGIGLQKSLLENKKTSLDLNSKKAERLGSIAGAITDTDSLHTGIVTALGEGLIDKDSAAQLLQGGFTPETQRALNQIKQQALSAKEQHDAAIADIESQIKQAKEAQDKLLRPLELTSAQNAAAASAFAPAKAAADALSAQQEAAGQKPIQPVDQARLDAEAQARAETARHNLSAESTAKIQAAVAQGRLKQEQMVNGLKYGPDTVEFWAKQLQDNPDSVKELPPELKTKVGQQFRAATGLPLPTALSGPVQQSETAARNALDNIDFIRNALKNPEIQKNIGPIMGRLGNAEQAIGTAAGLSPEASQLAQELRTRMRYFVFQEGKAILGGRLPTQLMGQLESSSANVKMDPNMLEGALKGAEGSAGSVIDNADRQRFGGAMRPLAMRRGAATSDQPREIKTKAEFDALPSGTIYLEEGKKFKKP